LVVSPYAAEATISVANRPSASGDSTFRRRGALGSGAAAPHSTHTSWRSSCRVTPHSGHARRGASSVSVTSGTADQSMNPPCAESMLPYDPGGGS
jgi:hypothetical protein